MELRVEKEKNRGSFRLWCGKKWYTTRRYMLWKWGNIDFAQKQQIKRLPACCFQHSTPVMRRLKDVDMWMQENKVINLRLAVEAISGILIHPGETFSYWKLIGKPTRRKGYVEGMVLKSGSFSSGIGGGLCQLSNLIFWMACHTPLTIRERHRHSYDVFPDSNRTQPFGSGATCYYNYMDLMLENNTDQTFQLCFSVTEKELKGQVFCEKKLPYTYEVYEKDHRITAEYWGGYTRNNVLRRRTRDADGSVVKDEYLTENHALMMYEPMVEGKKL
ncbi:VanW family protein [bacterium 210820-DFI.6.37]|nr:VanW family protein [bacterium 210820-DFI.6.37]